MNDAKATDKAKVALAYAIRCFDNNEPCISGNRAMTKAMARALEHEGWLVAKWNTGIHWEITEAGRAAYNRS